MDALLSHVTKTSHEIGPVTVGSFFVIIAFFYNLIPLNNLTLFSLSSAERIIIFIVVAYVTGKIFNYVGIFIITAIEAAMSFRQLPKQIKFYVEKLSSLQHGLKKIDRFPDNLILTPNIYKFISSDDNIERGYMGRMASHGFCMSFFGLIITLPFMFPHLELTTYSIWRVSFLLILIMALNSDIKLRTYIGHCAKASIEK